MQNLSDQSEVITLGTFGSEQSNTTAVLLWGRWPHGEWGAADIMESLWHG